LFLGSEIEKDEGRGEKRGIKTSQKNLS